MSHDETTYVIFFIKKCSQVKHLKIYIQSNFVKNETKDPSIGSLKLIRL